MTQVIVKRKQDDELMHAGHKYVKKDVVNGKTRYYYDYNDGDGWSNKVGVSVSKNKNSTDVSLFNTKADGYYRKHQKGSTKKYGALTVNRAEDGTEYSVKIPTKKIKSVTKKTIKKGKERIKKLLKIK